MHGEEECMQDFVGRSNLLKYSGVVWTELTQDKEQRKVLVNTVMSLQVP
jgi:hypothetical protein